MAKMAEDFTRVVDGILTGRRQRSELATEIKKATRSRGNEIRSLLESLKASRGRASREYRKEAIAATGRRRKEVTALLGQFGREQIARRQHRQELATAQRDTAAAFMRDLTSRVAALRDGFAKQGRDRTAAIRERLGGYALDRRNAIAIWNGSLREKRAVVQSAGVNPRPAATAAPAVHAEAPLPRSVPAKADEIPAEAAQSSDQQSHRSGRRNFGHGGSNKPHGEDPK